jgi:hypothetical protein
LPLCPDAYEYPSAISVEGTLLCNTSVIAPNGTRTNFSTLGGYFVARPKPNGGFWAVTNSGGSYERWSIDIDGTTSKDGTYLNAEGWKGINVDGVSWSSIDGSGRFYRWATQTNASVDTTVVRFENDFVTTTVVYDESKKPICRLFQFSFIPVW